MIDLPAAHLVGVGGALGALLRHWVSQAVEVEGFPASTLAVNVAGSFALGLFTFLGLGSDALLFLGVGACGSFTTFSSFSFQTVRLWETGNRTRAAVNATANLLGAALAIGLAYLVSLAI